MKTANLIAACVCGFLALTFVGFTVWCWAFSYWTAAPQWLAAPNYWAFTGCWMFFALLPLSLFGLNGTDQDNDQIKPN